MPTIQMGKGATVLDGKTDGGLFLTTPWRGPVDLSTKSYSMHREAVYRWRRQERKRLIIERLAFPIEERNARAARIAAHLDILFPNIEGRVISLYWPHNGEPDLRSWAEALRLRGGRCALPVVANRAATLVFRSWQREDPLVQDLFGMPVPQRGDDVTPDIVIAPVVGFDEAAFRLGYGDGCFDRTFAAMSKRPCIVGLGYLEARVRTIFPLEHDIPMDAIITDRGIEGYGRNLYRIRVDFAS